MKNNTIDSNLLKAQVAIDNALNNPPVQEALALYGFTAEKIQEGKDLQLSAQSAHDLQKKEYGEQFSATDKLDEAVSVAYDLYMRHVKVARVALKEQRGALEQLQAVGRRKQSYSGRLEQSKTFYNNALANEDIKTTLAAFGIAEANLLEGVAAVENFELRLAERLKEKGEAQEATKTRDQALDTLLDWFSDFVAIARIALSNNPQRLEILGIIEPS